MLSVFKSKKALVDQDQEIRLENCIDPVEELKEEDLLLVSGGFESIGMGGNFFYS